MENKDINEIFSSGKAKIVTKINVSKNDINKVTSLRNVNIFQEACVNNDAT